MSDKDILIDYFKERIEECKIGEPHKVYLYEEKIEKIDWLAGTKWGQEKINELKRERGSNGYI